MRIITTILHIISISNLVLLAFAVKRVGRDISSIVTFNLQSELTVSSIKVNLKRSTTPEWVQHILGNESVFFGSEVSAIRKTLSPKPLDPMEISRGRDLVRSLLRSFSPFQSFQHVGTPMPCNIEILAFARTYPQTHSLLSNRSQPIINVASLRIGTEDVLRWNCIYRGMHENWRFESIHSEPHYRALLLYCLPQLSDFSSLALSCDAMNHLANTLHNPTESLDASLELHIAGSNKVLRTTFQFRIFTKNDNVGKQGPSVLTTTSMKSRPRKTILMNTPDMAVCLAIPYVSSDMTKLELNHALLAEWTRYYSLLGFKVMLFDRDGANYDALFSDSLYKTTNRIPDFNADPNVYYYNYTVRGLLDNSRQGMKYDNTEPFIDPNNDLQGFSYRRSRFESQGHDKLVTFTHCRFEAKALFGIESVLVVDYDEFLYCPFGGDTVKRQADYIRRMIAQHRSMGTQQLLLPQRQTLNLTESPKLCMSEHAKAGESVLTCFAAYPYTLGGHSVKSFHLQHVCPLTGYHFACPDTSNAPRTCDCLCNSRHINERFKKNACALLHISLKSDGAFLAKKIAAFSESTVQQARQTPNSLYALVNQRNDPKDAQIGAADPYL